MKRLQTMTHNLYETTVGNRNFLIFVDMLQMKTFIYMETDKENVYYQEDRIWTDGKTEDEAAQCAEDYINQYIGIMEENRDFSMERAKEGGTINGYARMINRSWVAA